MNESVGFAAFITNLVGNLMLARKSERGWWIRIIANFLWFAYAWETAGIAMIANSVTFLGINIYALLKWRGERIAMTKINDVGTVGTDTMDGRAARPHMDAVARERRMESDSNHVEHIRSEMARTSRRFERVVVTA